MDNINDNDPTSSIDPNDWVEHFEELTKKPVSVVMDSHMQEQIALMESSKTFSQIDFGITLEEVRKAINFLKHGKSAGPDQVINELLKYSINEIFFFFYCKTQQKINLFMLKTIKY